MNRSRRDFLFRFGDARAPSGLSAALSEAASSCPNASFPSDREFGEVPLITVSREAMKGEFEVDFHSSRYPQGTEAAMDALDEVTRLEEKLSFFRINSRISYLNAMAMFEPVPVDEELFNLLATCQKIARSTDGAVDITSTPLWKVWGFARREGRIPGETEIKKALEKVGDESLLLDAAERTVRFAKPGMEINLGCVGKGFALDVAAGKMLEHGVEDFLIHGGFSSVLARGRQEVWPCDANGRIPREKSGWKVGITDPMRFGKRREEILLRNAAIGTSGSQQQFFRHRGKRYSHIIDPKSGWPAEKMLAVTVLAPTATSADMLSTAFFVMGAAEIEKYCEEHPGINAIATMPIPGKNGYKVHYFPNDSTFRTPEDVSTER